MRSYRVSKNEMYRNNCKYTALSHPKWPPTWTKKQAQT